MNLEKQVLLPLALALTVASTALSTAAYLKVSALASAPPAVGRQVASAPGPCKEIAQACQGAGFVKGGAKEGNGLYHDCVGPLLKGTEKHQTTAKALPVVAPTLIAQCTARREQLQKTMIR